MSQETFLNLSKIWIFGRVMRDMAILHDVYKNFPQNDSDANDANSPVTYGNNFLLTQINKAEAKFARIYSFSYEASFYDLARPIIFLVHGEGIDPEGTPALLTPDQQKLSRMPGDSGRTGLSSQLGSFAAGMRAWAYDRSDFTLRLDVESGTFDMLLLASEMDDWGVASRSAGSVARSSGSVARAAGSVARAAGSVARSRRGGGNTE